MYETEIEAKIRNLPENIRMIVLDYIEFLLSKYGGQQIETRKFKFDWEGGLSVIKEKFSSVELQHKVLGWR